MLAAGCEDNEMVERLSRAGYLPSQEFAIDVSLETDAVVDTAFNLRSFLVVIPCRDDQSRKLISFRIEAAKQVETGKPCPTAALVDSSPFSPPGD